MRFSERHGFRSSRTIFQINSMDSDLRIGLWNLLSSNFFPQRVVKINNDSIIREIVFIVYSKFLKITFDDIYEYWSSDYRSPRMVIRKWYFGAEWYDVYDFIEFCFENLIDNDRYYDILVENCNNVLADEGSGYRIVGGNFVQITSEVELDSIDAALMMDGVFTGVSTHIQSALSHLSRKNKPDFRNSIKESISAVEAVCCIIAGDTKATLGQALKKLESVGIDLHPSLRISFDKLYGYTSDADGIRHALIDDAHISYDDAKFMLVTCSAFVGYLRSLWVTS